MAVRIKLIFTLLALVFCAGCAVYGISGGEVIVINDGKPAVSILAGQSTSDAGSEDMINAVLERELPGVAFEWTCVDWGDRFASQMTGKLASGEMPDIIIGKAQDVDIYRGSGAIAPPPEEALAGIDESALALVTKDGIVWGIPYNTIFQGVLYNKDIFRALNITPPGTREQLQSAVAKLESAGITPFASHYQESWAAANVTMQLLVNDVLGGDPEWGKRFREGKTGFKADERLAGCLMQHKYILEHSFPDALQINQHECDMRFARGEAGMYVTGTWSMQAVGQIVPPCDVGIFPYPAASGNAMLITETNMTLMKGGSCRNPELADRALIAIASDETLAGDITGFTHSISTMKALKGGSAPGVDIAGFEGGIINVAAGNSQLLWPFQTAVAEQTLLWLQGRLALDDVLEYADSKRGLS